MKLRLNVFLIDYVWYIGERFYRQEKSPGDGNMLIAMCWYCTFFLPLSSIINRLRIPAVIQIAGTVFLLIIPFIFCRIRYNPRRKESIRLRYKNKRNWGRRLLVVWGFLIMIVAMECIVLIKIGLWHIGT